MPPQPCHLSHTPSTVPPQPPPPPSPTPSLRVGASRRPPCGLVSTSIQNNCMKPPRHLHGISHTQFLPRPNSVWSVCEGLGRLLPALVSLPAASPSPHRAPASSGPRSPTLSSSFTSSLTSSSYSYARSPPVFLLHSSSSSSSFSFTPPFPPLCLYPATFGILGRARARFPSFRNLASEEGLSTGTFAP